MSIAAAVVAIEAAMGGAILVQAVMLGTTRWRCQRDTAELRRRIEKLEQARS